MNPSHDHLEKERRNNKDFKYIEIKDRDVHEEFEGGRDYLYRQNRVAVGLSCNLKSKRIPLIPCFKGISNCFSF